MTLADANTDRVVLDNNGTRDEATFVGPSMFGLVYRSSRGTAWYRLIPVELSEQARQAEQEWRHSMRTNAPSPTASILTSTRDWHQTFENEPWLVVSYETSRPGRSLAQCVQATDATLRLRSGVATLRALPGWWETLNPPLMPLPADIVFNDDGSVQLLWIPRTKLPDGHTAFANPERILYLPPEQLRSATNVDWDASTWQAVDRYAIGVTLLGCYCQLPDLQPTSTVMVRAVTGSLYQQLLPREDLPPWLNRFSNHRNTVSLLRRLTSSKPKTRLDVDLRQLADRLEGSQVLFDPRAAVAWLRDQTKPQEALELLEELFPLTMSLEMDVELQYDLLCLAGELCARYLCRELEALDYYERAITLNGRRREAYREQLRVIASSPHHVELDTIVESSATVGNEFDVKLWRDYRFLMGSRTTHATEEEDELDDRLVARYLLWRRKYDDAQKFILPRLCDETNHYMWWDFELNLSHGWAFLGLGDSANLESAAQQVQQIKQGLEFVRQNHSIDSALVQQYGEELADLEYRVFQARSNATSHDPRV